ncbi:acyl-ACP--UDP-N-acetylglucosamine O-acyltransferase [bacterium]|nr:acyl-ACP--UDP-N-acetylglucosamine O-acyltransferase [bacterium]
MATILSVPKLRDLANLIPWDISLTIRLYMDIVEIKGIIPHRYPMLLVDRIIQYDARTRVVGLKNVTANEPFFNGHFEQDPIMPGTLILEALAQTGYVGLMSDSEFRGRLPLFASMDNVKFRAPVRPGDQLRLEMDMVNIRDRFVKMTGNAFVDGRLVVEGVFVFNLSVIPSRPQIHPTASVHASAILGKDVEIGPNVIIGEHVIVGDRTKIEANAVVEKWTRIGADNHIHFGCVIGSDPQDAKYKGERTWVGIGDRNIIREYVTINRATGKNETTEIGSDNLILTSSHIAHNCRIGNFVTVVNQVNIAGHCDIADRAIIGGMTGIHQFTRIGEGAMIGAYTRLPRDVPPFMLCEGNPAIIRNLNLVGLRRRGMSRDSINEIRTIYRLYYQGNLNATQAIDELSTMQFQSAEAIHLMTFLTTDSPRGILKRTPDSGAVGDDD